MKRQAAQDMIQVLVCLEHKRKETADKLETVLDNEKRLRSDLNQAFHASCAKRDEIRKRMEEE